MRFHVFPFAMITESSLWSKRAVVLEKEHEVTGSDDGSVWINLIFLKLRVKTINHFPDDRTQKTREKNIRACANPRQHTSSNVQE